MDMRDEIKLTDEELEKLFNETMEDIHFTRNTIDDFKNAIATKYTEKGIVEIDVPGHFKVGYVQVAKFTPRRFLEVYDFITVRAYTLI